MNAMRAGEWTRAFAINDAVMAARDPATRDDPRLPYHERWVWDGTPPDDRDVLVRCYHGFGDTLQFCRFLAPLRARARSVTLEVQAPLRALMDRVVGVDRIVGFDPAAPLPPRACEAEIMELAHVLRLSPRDVPPPVIRVEPVSIGSIGVCWRAGDWDRTRSIPLPSLLAMLPDEPLVSLQRGPAAREATPGRFANPGDDDPDVLRTAALIAGCAEVVTVDTMVAHLAATLGVPTTVLLRHDADWRWMQGGRTDWYPAARLLRQTVAGDWSSLPPLLGPNR